MRRPLANNKLRIRGVHQRKNGKCRYRAMISIEGKHKHLGYFDTIEEASAAYANAANGEFACTLPLTTITSRPSCFDTAI
jgi:hypothetical protein